MINTVNISLDSVLSELDKNRGKTKITLCIPSEKEYVFKTETMKVHVVKDFVRATRFEHHTLYTYTGAGGLEIISSFVGRN